MSSKILLLSAYDAASHRLWRERLVALFPEYQWTQLILPPRNFSWRIRGNSLLWGFGETEILERDYQLLIATSMVDLSSLRGFVPALSKLPTLVYFHENQFVYPPGSQRSENIEPQLVPLYSALCADAVVFNSHYNRTTFLEGAKSLFQRLPDQLPRGLLPRLENSQVMPVPLARFDLSAVSKSTRSAPLEIVWNHRWEYDKGPALLLEIVKIINKYQLPLNLHIVGEQFRQQPPQFDQIRRLLIKHAENLKLAPSKFGYITDQESYYQLLARCDAVLSTALHDFQGLAIQEACAAGCTPLAPDNLVYSEYLDAQYLYSMRGKDRAIAGSIVDKLVEWHQQKVIDQPLPKVNLDQYQQQHVRSRYADIFSSLLNHN